MIAWLANMLSTDIERQRSGPNIATLTINQLCEVTANAPKLVPSAVSGNAWEGPGASGTWEGLCRLPLLYEWFVEECENGPLVSDISQQKLVDS